METSPAFFTYLAQLWPALVASALLGGCLGFTLASFWHDYEDRREWKRNRLPERLIRENSAETRRALR